jgi:hypothetical protein
MTDFRIRRRLVHVEVPPDTARPLRAVRQFAWLDVSSGKAALSRPGRAPGWCPIPSRRFEPVEITRTPKGAQCTLLDSRVEEMV